VLLLTTKCGTGFLPFCLCEEFYPEAISSFLDSFVSVDLFLSVAWKSHRFEGLEGCRGLEAGFENPAHRIGIYKNHDRRDIPVPLIFATTPGYSSHEPFVILTEDVDKMRLLLR
jgi:hypothetical protein